MIVHEWIGLIRKNKTAFKNAYQTAYEKDEKEKRKYEKIKQVICKRFSRLNKARELLESTSKNWAAYNNTIIHSIRDMCCSIK